MLIEYIKFKTIVFYEFQLITKNIPTFLSLASIIILKFYFKLIKSIFSYSIFVNTNTCLLITF